MLHLSKLLTTVAILGALASCTTEQTPGSDAETTTEQVIETSTITGQLAYRERIALTPGHVMTVTLSDISVADRAAPVLATQSVDLNRQQVPLPFELSVDMSDLQSRNRYAVRGEVRGPDGKLAWTTDTAHLVDPTVATQDLGVLRLIKVEQNSVYTADFMCDDTPAKITVQDDILTLRVDGRSYDLPQVISASGAKYEKDDVMFWSKGETALMEIDGVTYKNCKMENPGKMTAAGDLSGTSWQVENVANGGIIDRSNLTLEFGTEGRLSGSSGCNQYTTSYEARSENSLSVDAIAGTRKACPPALMDLEQKFLSILGTATSYEYIENTGGLRIKSEDGRTLEAMPSSK